MKTVLFLLYTVRVSKRKMCGGDFLIWVENTFQLKYFGIFDKKNLYYAFVTLKVYSFRFVDS